MKPVILPKLCLLFLLCASSFAADNAADSLTKAEAAYQAGNFAGAKELYAKLAGDDASQLQNAAFLYNYGTVLMKSNEASAAYAYLWKARLLAPTDGDIHNNLEFARTQLSPEAKNIQASGLFSTAPQEIFLFSKLEWLCLSLLGLFVFLSFSVWQRQSLVAKSISLVLFVLALGIAASYQIFEQEHLAVVIGKEAKLRSGPGANFPEIMDLQSGAAVSIKEHREGWIKLEFSHRNEKGKEIVGWLESGAALSLSN